ncbi:Polypyrimidine tract-binding protein 2, variant 2 [Dermatophagoides farinae]|uniref:Polypyrimidine tract-binding protein 2, variant 2 n=1 Tax=Dermatophagoides farinae TaxID=6954 RepID=A0A922L855_DERFA|nr:Polypyrimidine tract-binding protein 2, variant 2 [Dermatophagoides farinae]
MTKRGIDDLSFNSGNVTVVQSSMSSTTTETMNSTPANSSAIPVKVEDRDSKSIEKSLDYLNGNGSNGSTIHLESSSGAMHQNHHSNNKKFKSSLESSAGILPASGKSRVVHIRNIPAETSAQELIILASPFGKVTNYLFVRSKCQAFVEFESHFSAMQMAAYWIQTTIGGIPTHVQPTIKGRHVHVQVSNHKELRTHEQNNGANNGLPSSFSNGMADSYAGLMAEAIDQQQADVSLTPSPVIRVIIENQIYPITLDGLYQAFSRLGGKVLRILTFQKNQQLQALVQFGDLATAIQAKTSYDGQSCYPGSSAGFNVMRIEYSILQNLIVKCNNDRSRDYTTSTTNGNGISLINGQCAATAINGSTGQSVSTSNSNSAVTNHLTDPTEMAASLFNLTAGAAALSANNFSSLTPLGGGGLTTNGHHRHHATNSAASIILNQQQNAYLAGHPYTSLQQAILANCGAPSLAAINPTSTANAAAAAAMFAAGVYGDVIRVKILFNKKDTALIQMAEPNQAQNAISYLDRTRLFGKTIHVMSSKHQMVQMPKEGHQDSGLTKDYANSPLHRFKRPGSKNYNNIYPPSETLHVSNIPPTCSEDDLRRSFQQETGKQIQKFKFFPNDHRMALIQFDSIEDAVLSLIKMHNFKVAEHSHLRVSFSKSPIPISTSLNPSNYVPIQTKYVALFLVHP